MTAVAIDDLRRDLESAVTGYDRRQAPRRFYNPHALSIYLGRVDDVCADVAGGMGWREAIQVGFTDRLRDAILRHMEKAGWRG